MSADVPNPVGSTGTVGGRAPSKRVVVGCAIGAVLALLAAVLVATRPWPGGGGSAPSSLRLLETSWVANTFAGGAPKEAGSAWVQHDVDDIAVDGAGTVYATTRYDEGTREVGVYRNGMSVGRFKETHGFGRKGGAAIALDRTHAYVAMAQSHEDSVDSPAQGTWYAFRRYDVVNFEPSSLPRNGRGQGDSMRVVSTSSEVTGLAVSDTEVFAASAGDGRVRVYSKASFEEVRSWSAGAVTKLALDSAGDVWAISGSEVRQYSPSGELRRSISGLVRPTAIAFNGSGQLLVATDGPRQQVQVYDVSASPVEVGAIGVQGGMFSAPRGAAGPLRFNGLTGVGVDAGGNVYVANGLGGAGTDIRKLAVGSHEQQWQVLGLAFVDNADVDPTDDSVVYTSRDRFEIDYTKPAGQQWTWRAHTVDRFAHPEDRRTRDTHQYVTPDVVSLKGTKLMFQTGMYQDDPRFYRFEGEIAVPSTRFEAADGDWAWQVDSRGDVWSASEAGGIHRHPFQGIDGAGNPMYGHRITVDRPEQLETVQRVHYDPATDVMILSGWTERNSRPEGTDLEKLIGREIIRYDGWSRGNRKPKWRVVVPLSREGTDIRNLRGQIGMSVAGDYVFTVEMATSKVRAYRLSNGSRVDEWVPGAEVRSYVGVVDVPDGIRAARLDNGEYLVFVEEDHAAKVLMHRLVPKEN